MKKEKVYIVVSHKHSLKKGTTEWEVSETVEFVNQLRTRHQTMSSAIGDYINRKMIKGERMGMGDYDKFERYVRSKYEKEMSELDASYEKDRAPVPEKIDNTITDAFGNVRARTVFDKVPA